MSSFTVRPSLGENHQVIHHTEMVGNHHIIGMQSPVLPFERRVISTLMAGELTVENKRNFARIHYVMQNGNMVILPSFTVYYYRATHASTRCLFLVLINKIYCYTQHYNPWYYITRRPSWFQ